MADTVTLNAGAGGATLGTDEVTIGGTLQHVQRVKLVDGTDGGTGLIGGDATNGLDVDVTRVGGNVTVVGAAADGAAASGNPVLVAGFDGTNAQSLSTTAGGLLQVHDGAGSLTVDAPAGTPVFVRLSDGAAAITALPVTDNAGSLTVDAPVGTPAFVRLSDGASAITTLPVSLASAPTTAVTLAAGAAAIAKAEDVASADADVGVPSMAVRKATPANTSGTDGDYEMLQMSAGRLWASATIDAALPAGTNAIGKLAANDGVDVGDVTINNASGAAAVNIQDGGNSITVDGTVAATQSGTWTVQPGNTANTIAWKVDGSAVTQPVSGTFWQATQPVSGTVTAVDAGDVASDGVDSGNPVKIGMQARTSDVTAVSSADRVNAIATILGKLIVKLDAVPDLTWSYAAAAGGLVTTSGVTAKAAGGAGVRNYVKSCQVINSHATISTEVVIRDGAAGTVLHRGWAQAAGGGYAMVFDPPLRGTAATLIEIAEVSTTGTAGVLVSLQGYTAAE